MDLKEKIDAFLSERRASDGGYAPVTEDDMRQLKGIIDALIAEKWEEDADGDVPVEYKLVDRNRYSRLSFYPVPYYEEYPEGYKRIIHLNAQVAMDQFGIMVRLELEEMAEKKSE